MPPDPADPIGMRSALAVSSSIDVVMVQCWLFGLELCAGASFAAFLELLEEEWPSSYRPRAKA